MHWTSVHAGKGHGQAKPIERGFGWGGLSEYCDKDPRLAGAYTGNNPTAKPDNYGSRAIPLEIFLQVLEQAVISINTRIGRRTESAYGELSYEQAFNASYEQANIKKATAEQRRLWLLSAEGVRVQQDGSISLDAGSATGIGKNRYHCDELYKHVGNKVVARFDPQALYEHVYVYTLDNQFIGKADCIAAVGFGDTQQARDHNRARKQMLKASKEAAKAQQAMDALEVGRQLPQQSEPKAPETQVVTGIFPQHGNAAIAVESQTPLDAEEDTATERSFSKAVRLLKGGKNQ